MHYSKCQSSDVAEKWIQKLHQKYTIKICQNFCSGHRHFSSCVSQEFIHQLQDVCVAVRLGAKGADYLPKPEEQLKESCAMIYFCQKATRCAYCDCCSQEVQREMYSQDTLK